MKIGIIGLGLIGGSIFKELRQNHDVIAVSRSVVEKNVFREYSVLSDCDLVFVCTPMNVTLEILSILESVLSENTIVTDVCSLKSFVSKKRYNFKFIPSHPMAGTENSGWESSFVGLFKGAKWAITPLDGIILSEQEVLENIIKELGATPIITTPLEHDEAVAFISHFPLVVAQALCKNIEDNKLAQILASTGFKDTTRLALSNTEMAFDMVDYNKENIIKALDCFNDNIKKMINDDYKQEAKIIKKIRKELFD